MIFKVIHENPTTEKICELIQNLDTEQFYFIERACRARRQARNQQQLDEWQKLLTKLKADDSSPR